MPPPPDTNPPDDAWDDTDDGAPSTLRTSVGALPGAGFPSHGARLMLDGAGTVFRLYAPLRTAVDLVLYERVGPQESKRVRMFKGKDGFHAATVRGIGAGARYAFIVDGEGPLPDPASRHQPLGVHGPSEVIDLRNLPFTHTEFRGRPLEELIIYEVHVGAATAEGTFRALAAELPRIAEIGFTAVLLLPIGEAPGNHGVGDDVVLPFAPAHGYGRPEDFAALVDTAHAHRMAVILDVAFDRFGPEGNALGQVTPACFAPSGDRLHVDGPHREAMRALVLENVELFVRDYRVDGLCVHTHPGEGQKDERPLVSHIADAARACASEREVIVIAGAGEERVEGPTLRNDARLVREAAHGGLGLDAMMAGDLHGSIQRLITLDDEGPYGDFAGSAVEVAKIARQGWLFEGQVAPSTGKRRGTPSFEVGPPRIVVFLEDRASLLQKPRGERLRSRAGLPAFRAATALLFALPYTPLLFMGDEHASFAPFALFSDLSGPFAQASTRSARARFSSLRAFGNEEARKSIPDPQLLETFHRAKIDHGEAARAPGKLAIELCRSLIELRRHEPAMKARGRGELETVALGKDAVLVRRRPLADGPHLLFVIAFGAGTQLHLGGESTTRARPGKPWSIVLDTEDVRFGGEAQAVLLGGKELILKSAGAVVLKS